MCGRFTLTVNPSESQDAFEGFTFPAQFAPRFNIAPTQPVLAIPNDGGRAAGFFVWGLIPSWAKDPSIGNRLINARGETLAEKPAFRGGYKYKRCLIPANGFYEWKAQPGSKAKTPHFIHLKTGEPFAFAGLWDEWHSPDGSAIRSCTIVTTTPNALMAPIHNRMPVILDPRDYAEWLDKAVRTPESLNHLLRAFPAELMEAHPVSMLVNSPANDRAECILPVA
jgi:putative SOS response-associated peptidase YedK